MQTTMLIIIIIIIIIHSFIHFFEASFYLLLGLNIFVTILFSILSVLVLLSV